MLQKIADLAKQSPYAEICGVIILDRNSGQADVVSVRNIATTSAVAEFIMDPMVWVRLQRDVALGRNPDYQLVARFHSHPFWAARPSIVDREACVYNQLEVIYSNTNNDFICYTNYPFLRKTDLSSEELLTSFVDEDESGKINSLPELHRVNFKFSEGEYFENYSDWCRRHRFLSGASNAQAVKDGTAS